MFGRLEDMTKQCSFPATLGTVSICTLFNSTLLTRKPDRIVTGKGVRGVPFDWTLFTLVPLHACFDRAILVVFLIQR
jgi:hypothetical protein